MPRLFLLSRMHLMDVYEVLSVDTVKQTAVLKRPDGTVVNEPCFVPYMIKRVFVLTDQAPDWAMEKNNAEFAGVRTGL